MISQFSDQYSGHPCIMIKTTCVPTPTHRYGPLRHGILQRESWAGGKSIRKGDRGLTLVDAQSGPTVRRVGARRRFPDADASEGAIALACFFLLRLSPHHRGHGLIRHLHFVVEEEHEEEHHGARKDGRDPPEG